MANKIVREIIHAKGIDIGIYTKDFENEYISLTDIAKYRNDNDPRFVIQNWMRNRNTVEFLAVWEELHNPDFNRVQFEAGSPARRRLSSKSCLNHDQAKRKSLPVRQHGQAQHG